VARSDSGLRATQTSKTFPYRCPPESTFGVLRQTAERADHPVLAQARPGPRIRRYFTCLDREGRVYDPDKVCMWAPGRIAWTFAYLHNEFSPNPAWLEFAKLGVDFIRRTGSAPTAVCTMGCGATERRSAGRTDITRRCPPYWAWPNMRAGPATKRFTRSEAALRPDLEGHSGSSRRLGNPVEGKRPHRIHGYSMITVNVLQTLRNYREEPTDAERISHCIDVMRRYHTRPDRKVLFEIVGWNGEDIPAARRWVNPGHMIEGASSSSMKPAIGRTGHADYGLDLIRWGFERGWIPSSGGSSTTSMRRACPWRPASGP